MSDKLTVTLIEILAADDNDYFNIVKLFSGDYLISGRRTYFIEDSLNAAAEKFADSTWLFTASEREKLNAARATTVGPTVDSEENSANMWHEFGGK